MELFLLVLFTTAIKYKLHYDRIKNTTNQQRFTSFQNQETKKAFTIEIIIGTTEVTECFLEKGGLIFNCRGQNRETETVAQATD